MDEQCWISESSHRVWWATLVLVTVAVYLFIRLSGIHIRWNTDDEPASSERKAQCYCHLNIIAQEKDDNDDYVAYGSKENGLTAVLSSSRLMYHELHNVEQFPRAVGNALKFLQALLPLTSRQAHLCLDQPNILRVGKYDPQALRQFIARWDNHVQDQWQEYLQGRKTHRQPRQLFQNVSSATHWLKQISPSKLVDGVWLTHASIATANTSMQEVQRSLWQTLSEEYGDGELAKNHVHVFQQLLRSQIPDFPDPSQIQYVDPALEMDCVGSWTSALTQLAIPHAADELGFVPELLGFNLHFELVALETLQAMYELREVGLDSSYFALHVSIDNSDSGHTAMALNTVIHFMNVASKSVSPAESEELWSRVQAGFCLSQFVSSLPVSVLASVHARLESIDRRYSTDTDITSQVVDMIRRKSLVSAKLHCGSRVRLRGRTLVEWMNPKLISQEDGARSFVDALASTKPWVHRGDSKRSHFVKEISWGGRMFGSFTETEVDVLVRWIDSLDPCGLTPGRHQLLPDCSSDREEPNTTLHSQQTSSLPPPPRPTAQPSASSCKWIKTLCQGPFHHREDFLALWIVTPCLLEGFLRVPSKAATQFGSHVVSIIRAQYGFTDARLSVSGTDDTRRDCSDTCSLEDIVWQIMNYRIQAPSNLNPRSSTERRAWLSQSSFASQIMSLAARPWSNVLLLLGMAQGLVELHKAFAADNPCLLPSSKHRYRLGQIATIEDTHIKQCIARTCRDGDYGDNASMMLDLARGHDLVRQEIARIFG